MKIWAKRVRRAYYRLLWATGLRKPPGPFHEVIENTIRARRAEFASNIAAHNVLLSKLAASKARDTVRRATCREE